jgi:Xaa-Pro aminopeptidase
VTEKMTIMHNEHKRRRKQLMRTVGRGNIAIIASASATVRNNDVEHPYRQDSDFYYLSGFAEPDAVAVFIPGRKQGEYILFCREFDEKKALWTGKNAGLHGARTLYGADDAFPINDLDEILPGMLENRARVYYPMGRDTEMDQRLMEWVNQLRQQSRGGVHAPVEFVSLEHLLHEMRLQKSAAEIQLMRQAAKISAQAHIRAMQTCRPGLHEYHIEAELMHEFMRNGLRFPAYPPIVAGGKNACILHYTDNADELKEGDLLLIDAGAEHQYYAADVTRTFPVSGRFSEPQRAIYQLVLDAQQAAIKKVRPGARWNEPHDTAVRVLTKGLVKLGLLRGPVPKLIKDEAYKTFYMHKTGHWLGMDVHDVGEYKAGNQWRRLEPGMVLTVEPGLYIPESCKRVAKKWRGIGVRIEDDVLVTKDGCEVLSADVPSAIGEIEQLMRA